MSNISQTEIHAHYVRLAESLSSTGPQGSLFAYYLAMLQMTPAQLKELTAFSDVVSDTSVYSGIALTTAPKSSLYAENSDYITGDITATSLAQSKDPNCTLRWANYFSPQPLHFASAAILIDDDVIENCPYHTQQEMKPSSDDNNSFDENTFDNDTFNNDTFDNETFDHDTGSEQRFSPDITELYSTIQDSQAYQF